MKIQEITLCGGGNGVHTLIPLALNQGLVVNIWAPYDDEALRLEKNSQEGGGIKALFPDRVFKGIPHRISSRAVDVIPGAELIVIITPAFAHQYMLQEIFPLIREGATLVVIPSRSGLEYQYLSLGFLEKRVTLIGFQTLPWACRIEAYGQKVRILGVKKYQGAANIPDKPLPFLYGQLAEIIQVQIQKMESFLSLTLGNMGQLIHPGILYGMVRQYGEQEFLQDEIPDFYQSVDDFTAGILEGLSQEIQDLKTYLAHQLNLQLSAVLPLKEWLFASYRDCIEDPSSLKTAFQSNTAYQGLKAPVIEKGRGVFILDKNTRYVQEDLPFGLLVSKGLALLCAVKTPVMDEVITVLQDWMGKEYLREGDIQGKDRMEARIPQNYGIESLDDLMGVWNKQETPEVW